MRPLLFLCLALSLVACDSKPKTGPDQVRWDRDVCERCRMVVSDHHFAAQVRRGIGHPAIRFDDLGCALIWLEQQPWGSESGVELWVTDYESGDWLDAYSARYVLAQRTPMDYEVGATRKHGNMTISFADARKHIFAVEARHSGKPVSVVPVQTKGP